MKYSWFLLIGIYFIFTYPDVRTYWNLNQTIGWGLPRREMITYLYPFWFFLLFLVYKAAKAQKREPSPVFFWFHVLISLVPTFFFNHPFIHAGSTQASFLEGDHASTVFSWYKVVQLLLFLIIARRVSFQEK